MMLFKKGDLLVENILQILIEYTTLRMPRVAVAVFILIVFFIILKVIKRAIIKGPERQNLITISLHS